jgi:hypothetical protein
MKQPFNPLHHILYSSRAKAKVKIRPQPNVSLKRKSLYKLKLIFNTKPKLE